MHSLRTALIASWRSASGTTAATREGRRRCRRSRSRSRSWSQWSRRNSNGGVGGRKHRLNHPVPYRTSPGGPRHCTLFVSGSVVVVEEFHSLATPLLNPHTTPSPSVSLPYSGWPVLQGLRNLWIQRFMLLPAACCTQSLNPYIL